MGEEPAILLNIGDIKNEKLRIIPESPLKELADEVDSRTREIPLDHP